jgi:DNA-binding response OmpR family regulator
LWKEHLVAKILVVEDDVAVRATIVDWLEAEKHLVEATDNGKDALQMLQVYDYELLLLDWMLPDITGPEIVKKLRADGNQIPTIFLTGRDDLLSKTTGLDIGADDYLTKPVELLELSSRIRANLRRSGSFQLTDLTIKNVHLNASKRLVTVDGERVYLTTKEYAVLKFLMRHTNEIFGARALLDKVWQSDSDSSEGTVRVCVKTLRTKIMRGDRCILKTVLGAGYTIEDNE